MRALVKQKAEPGLDLVEVPEPNIGINDVLIKVLRTGICGTDLHIQNWDAWAQSHIKTPLVVGHEFVGEVIEVGEDCNTWCKVGDRVVHAKYAGLMYLGKDEVKYRVVNDEDMLADNMYDKEFDPHYLVDIHMNRILKYLGLKIPDISFDVYTTSGKYVYGFSKESGEWWDYYPNEKGERTKYVRNPLDY